jgi:hypothetical protein
VYHRANTAAPETDYLVLNSTAATADSDTRWNDTLPTSTVFSLGTEATVNASGGTYVAYLFAHDAGGFGDSGNDSVIKCGSFTYNSSITNSVDLGWEPQFVLTKSSSGTFQWYLQDSMRGLTADSTGNRLFPNSSSAEDTSGFIGATATGFTLAPGIFTNGSTHIYIAIRRGPMKTPTVGTEVFASKVGRDASSTTVPSYSAPITVDAAFSRFKSTDDDNLFGSRLQGKVRMYTNTTGAEVAASPDFSFDYQTGWGNIGGANVNFISWMFRRAPGFFDVVAYTGTGAGTVTHNLGVVPEMIICKSRSNVVNWAVYHSALGGTNYLRLNLTNASQSDGGPWNNTTPTNSVLSRLIISITSASGLRLLLLL